MEDLNQKVPLDTSGGEPKAEPEDISITDASGSKEEGALSQGENNPLNGDKNSVKKKLSLLRVCPAT